ncbi:hypothetical protein MaudCBS49596_008046, partial [Microsporum audouinii]
SRSLFNCLPGSPRAFAPGAPIAPPVRSRLQALRGRARFPGGLARPLSSLRRVTLSAAHTFPRSTWAVEDRSTAAPLEISVARAQQREALAFPEPGCVAVRLLQVSAASTS